MANKHMDLFTAAEINGSPTNKQKLSANYSFALQVVWTGLVGTAEFLMQVSMNDTNYDDFPVVDKDGNRLTSIPITGASGSFTIEVDSLISDWCDFQVDGSGASAGTVDAKISIIDNQDTY